MLSTVSVEGAMVATQAELQTFASPYSTVTHCQYKRVLDHWWLWTTKMFAFAHLQYTRDGEISSYKRKAILFLLSVQLAGSGKDTAFLGRLTGMFLYLLKIFIA